MNIQFLFRTRTVTEVALAAEVDPGTASKWRQGRQCPDWTRICKLYARGFLTDADLRAGGLAVPPSVVVGGGNQ